MIEVIILDYLNEVLNVPAFMESPEKPLNRYVLIEKTGGSSENYIYRAIVTLKSYAESLAEAAKLNEKVKEAMNNIIILDSIAKSKYNTDYNFTNTEKKEYRYQAVYEVFY